MPAQIDVTPVETKAHMDTFIRVPWRVYADDPAWAPPLLFERKRHLDPKTNPALKAMSARRLWTAAKDGTPVGRIAAHVNRAHLDRHGGATGHFGFIDCIDDGAVFDALFAAAEAWLRDQGMTHMAGPFNSTINEECGLLVDGFDTPPMLMMGHARPYYQTHLERLGYAKAQDMLAYRLDVTKPLLADRNRRLVDKVLDDPRVTVRGLNPKRFSDEVAAVFEIFNDAWSENWGFVPFSTEEIAHAAAELKPLIRPQSMAVAEVDGEPAAFALALPNINEAIRDLEGRLLPFGWAKFLYRLKFGRIRTARMPLMGLKKIHHATPMGALLSFAVIDRVHAAHKPFGIETAELSWILENNTPIRAVLDEVGAEAYKTYRIYARSL